MIAIACTLMAMPVTACGSDSVANPADDAAPASTVLAVAASGGLRLPLADIGVAFDAVHGTQTSFNFDASGVIRSQIEAGASIDVFASADPAYLETLVQKGLVDASTVKAFAGNEVVLVVPADSTLGVDGFADLADASVRRITYGDPATTSVGVIAERILGDLGLLEEVRPKVIYSATVMQSLAYVTEAEVDAGLVFATEAALASDKATVVATADTGWHEPITHVVGVVDSGGDKALALAFIDFLMTPEAQAILQKYGFSPAPSQ